MDQDLLGWVEDLVRTLQDGSVVDPLSIGINQFLLTAGDRVLFLLLNLLFYRLASGRMVVLRLVTAKRGAK